MRLLLDTQAWLWWLMGSSRLPQIARDAIADPANQPLISAASVVELAEKVRAGILSGMRPLIEDIEDGLDRDRFGRLPITTAHAARAATLDGAPDDLFDRILIAQAQLEDIVLISNDGRLDRLGVRRLWDR
jgi:PIN domain nuclease of toxin-antitoxin system